MKYVVIITETLEKGIIVDAEGNLFNITCNNPVSHD